MVSLVFTSHSVVTFSANQRFFLSFLHYFAFVIVFFLFHNFFVTDHCGFRFPLFVAVHKICKRDMAAENFIDCLREHPEHMS